MSEKGTEAGQGSARSQTGPGHGYSCGRALETGSLLGTGRRRQWLKKQGHGRACCKAGTGHDTAEPGLTDDD